MDTKYPPTTKVTKPANGTPANAAKHDAKAALKVQPASVPKPAPQVASAKKAAPPAATVPKKVVPNTVPKAAKKAPPATAAAAPEPDAVAPLPDSTLALFGKDCGTKPFLVATAEQIYQADGEPALRAYLRKYFAKSLTPSGFVMFRPKKVPIVFNPIQFAHAIGDEGKSTKLSRVGQTVKPHRIVNSFELVECVLDPSKPPVWEEDEQTYINLFAGWKYQRGQPKPTTAEMKLVEPFINHIRTVWCPNDQVMFEFVMRWFARIAQGGKNQIGLYLKGAQGIGKSIIFEFMRELVFGDEPCQITDRPNIILSDFNASLQGKAMLVLEEMPTENTGQYQQLTNKLKQICTGEKIQTTKKYAEEVTIKNTISVAVLTNRDALAFQEGDRRWAQLDLSEAKKGDMKYFEKLDYKQISKEKQNDIGLAMWRHLLHIDLTCKPDRTAPPTRSKAIHTVPLAATWIKETYLNPNPGKGGGPILKQKFCDFYDRFKDWHEKKRYKTALPDKKKFAQQLNMIKCIKKKEMRFGGNPVIGIADVPLEDIVREFDEKMWIDREVDDIIDPNVGAPHPCDQLLDDYGELTG